MPFDLAQWKTQLAENLREWKLRMTRAGINSAYAFIAATALYPVAQAAQQGDWSALAALGAVTASVGTNLIANQIQKWRDENDAALQLGPEAQTNDELRRELDAVLEKLDAFTVAQDALPASERAWFRHTLREELTRMGNLDSFAQFIVGDSNIAVQGNENAVNVLGEGATQIQQASGVGIAGSMVNAQAIIGGDKIEGGVVVVAKDGAQIVIGEQPIRLTAVQKESALGRYLEHVISRTRYLQLQGIRSGGKLVNIELESIFITLRATRTRAVTEEQAWLDEQARFLPGERGRMERGTHTETVVVKVQDALADHKRMVILGDPGSGKTTLLRYLALRYARDRAENTTFVRDHLRLNESGFLPLYLPLRNLGAYLAPRPDTGTEGHALMLAFLYEYLKNERIVVPDDFFDADLNAGRIVLLLDGMDEVGDENLRRRVTRLIDSFAGAYPQCRIVVTSRIVGYPGLARLEQDFATTTVQDFSLADVREFLTHWHRLVAIGQLGPGTSAEHFAASQTNQLLNAITSNPRVRELAVNPLMLTVIALVHRDRVKLPDRRAELYAEAVDVLLGKWDEARGVDAVRVLDDRPFDASDRRLLLQTIALNMQTAGKREIEADELTRQLRAYFTGLTTTPAAAHHATERFLQVIRERTGLLVEAGQGVYRFSHLTFQEYLAALAALDLPTCETILASHVSDAGWREVILLAIGQLATQGPTRTTSLVQRIADTKNPTNPYDPLVLAVEGVRDAGNGMNPQVAAEIQARVKKLLAKDRPAWQRILNQDRISWAKQISQTSTKSWVQEKGKLIEALVQSGAGYWTMPYGEPEWITIRAGEFWMGEGAEIHRVNLPVFKIARVPITNAQYLLYVQAADAPAPEYWVDKQPPRQLTSHPVVNLTWHDAQNYCKWLSEVTGKHIHLPSEAEWEKAARGSEDKRVYPWGDVFDASKCNTSELGLDDTSPVGVFPSGASPYGVLDMSGNVWEWTRSIYKEYSYNARDGREDLQSSDNRVLRGGSFFYLVRDARCADRFRYLPDSRLRFFGFRVVASPSDSGLW